MANQSSFTQLLQKLDDLSQGITDLIDAINQGNGNSNGNNGNNGRQSPLPRPYNTSDNPFGSMTVARMQRQSRAFEHAGAALGQFGGTLGKVGRGLTNLSKILKVGNPIVQLFITSIEAAGKALRAISDADKRQQDIQNQRNTMLSNRNIELSNIETEGNVDALNNFKDNMLSEYNQLFTKLQGQVAIANAKAIASTNAQIEGTIGDINNAAWNALAAQTDIWAQQQKLGLQVAKTNDVENRAIAQRNIELQNRQSERGFQSEQSVLKAQKQDVDLTIQDMNNAYEHWLAEPVNRMAGGSTEADNIKGDTKWNERYGRGERQGIMNRSVTGSNIAGAVNFLTVGLIDDYARAAQQKLATKSHRDLTNAQNDLNAAQAGNANRNKVQNTVIANSNEIKNKVLEGMTDIQSSVIDTQATIKKAYQKMAQSVEKWMMDFQDKIYDSGIQKGMTTRSQLDKYRSAMLPIMEEVSRKYGITKDEFVKMQSDYTAEGRSKLLNREDIKQQSSLGKIYLGGDFGTAAELANNTEIFNMGVSDTVDLMGEMSKQVNKIGLDGRKYLKDMVKNLKMAQKYDFKNGVKGMMNMAKWAQNTRFNMDNLPNMIEDIQKGGLEGIITKAAKLQVLGGRFAMGADPIAMAFEAYNDPAALAKRFNSMTMGMGRFNKETGEVEFNGMEMDQMRALAENSGQSIDDIKKQARYNVKKDRVEGFINDKTLSQEQRMDLVNKAYYQNGQWKVNDVTGNAVNLSEVNSSNINNIQADTYEGKMEQGMEQIVSFTKLFTGNTEANMAHLSDSINKNGAADNELWKRLEAEQEDFFTNSQKYADTILEKMQEATDAYKDFLNGFKDPADVEELVLTEIKGFREKTFAQLNSILRQMGGAASDIAKKNELADKAEIKEKKKRQNGDVAAVVRGQKNGTTTSEELKAAALMQMEKFSDSIVTSNNKQILTSAAKVTPINDGNVQLAKSDPKDTAIFAKTGGPFDTLFNDVFGRINDVYNEVHGNTSSDVIPTEPLGKDAIFAESPSISTQSTNDGKVQIDPVNIKIDGKLELTGSNGQTVDIISELNNNPMLLRAISDMIVQNISTKYYGGRPVGNSNFRK